MASTCERILPNRGRLAFAVWAAQPAFRLVSEHMENGQKSCFTTLTFSLSMTPLERIFIYPRKFIDHHHLRFK
jgi:hypothetical protein